MAWDTTNGPRVTPIRRTWGGGASASRRRSCGGLACRLTRRWLDVGCGTGALTATILAKADPAEIVGVDPSEGFLTTARARIDDARATFRTGDAQSLPVPDGHFDAVVSGLVLNFVPEPHRALAEFVRVARPGGVVAAYVWDYAEGMEMLRHFWDAATALDPAAADEGGPVCVVPAGAAPGAVDGGRPGARVGRGSGRGDEVCRLRGLLASVPRRSGARRWVRRVAVRRAAGSPPRAPS